MQGVNGRYTGPDVPPSNPGFTTANREETPVNNNGNGNRPVLEFDTNIPRQIALQYPDGKIIETRFGDKYMYSLAEPRGHVVFFHPIVAERIGVLGIEPGEIFNVCKREIKNGKKRVPQWDVWRPDEAEISPRAAQPPQPPQPPRTQAAPPPPPPPRPVPMPAASTPAPAPPHTADMATTPARPKTKLADALKTAVEAIYAAHEHARKIGFAVQEKPILPQFGADEICRMVNTLIIDMQRNGGHQ